MLAKAANLGVILFSGTDVFCCVCPVSVLRELEGFVLRSDPAAGLGGRPGTEGCQGWAGLGVGLSLISRVGPLFWGCAEPGLGLSLLHLRGRKTGQGLRGGSESP